MAKDKKQTAVARLPLHRASLFFVPEFTENFDDWKRGIEAILDQFDWGEKVTVEPLEDQLGITVVYRQITVSLFRGSGQLSLEYNPRYRLDDDYIPCLNCFGLPGSVCSKIDRFLRCRPLKTRQRALERDILETVASSILEVKECLRLNMRAAFQQGRARIEGRIDTPTASYSPIPSVQHFKASVPCKCSVVENCDHFTTLDERASPEGRPPQRLYDVHVAIDRPPEARAVNGAAADPETRCRAWLAKLVQENPEVSPFRKEDLKATAKSEYGVSGRAFDRIVADKNLIPDKIKLPPKGWLAIGRPPVSRRLLKPSHKTAVQK